jgi:hypothetical protein
MTEGWLGNAAENTLNRTDITGDVMDISYDSVWKVKGPDAPSAIDLGRREAVMDHMGVARQLIFPSFGLLGLQLMYNPLAWQIFGFEDGSIDAIDVGHRAIVAHNEWAAGVVNGLDSTRIRPAAIVDTSTMDQLMVDTEAALSAGLRAVWITSGAPPANTSPGDRLLDPFWKLLSDANAAVTLHIGTEFATLASSRWSNGVPQFAPAQGSSLEFPIEPFRSSTLHVTTDTFLSAMVLAGFSSGTRGFGSVSSSVRRTGSGPSPTSSTCGSRDSTGGFLPR